MTGLNQAAVVQSLGATSQYLVLSMDEINRLKPAFDLIDFTHANLHGAIAFRDEAGKLMVVFGNPFNVKVKS